MRMGFVIVLAIVGATSPAWAQQVRIGLGQTISFNQTVSTLTTGSILDVTGSVSADGRYVTMNAHPQFSNLQSLDRFDTFGNRLSAANTDAAGLPFRPAVRGRITLVENDQKLLEGEVPPMVLQETSLRHAVQKLATLTKQNIVLGHRALMLAGVDDSKEIEFNLAGGTLREAILTLLQQSAPNTEMVVTAEDNVVQVTTQAAADNNIVTKTYYLEDLIARLPRIVSSNTDLETMRELPDPKKDAHPVAKTQTAQGLHLNAFALNGSAVLQPGGPPIPAESSGVPSAADEPSHTLPAPAKHEIPQRKSGSTDIVEIITPTVRPELWKVNGGKYGEIAVVGNRVTVKAPQSVQAILDGPKFYDPNARPHYLNYHP